MNRAETQLEKIKILMNLKKVKKKLTFIKKGIIYFSNLKNKYLLKKRVKDAWQVAARLNYDPISTLGFGKDGVVIKAASKDNKYVVIKVLSRYALKFKKDTLLLKGLVSESRYHIPFELINDSCLISEFIELSHPYNGDLGGFAENFSNVCDLEIELLKKNYVAWDFGYTNFNYMTDENNQIKWVDYGGPCFLRIKNGVAYSSSSRVGLVAPSADFMVIAVILHWMWVVLSKVDAVKIMSKLQDGKISTSDARKIIQAGIKGTSIEFLNELNKYDLLNQEGWLKFKKLLSGVSVDQSNKTLEPADIVSVSIDVECTSIKGYQNYEIRNKQLYPLAEGHGWAKSLAKWKKVNELMALMSPCDTYLDIGSNLGMYVISAELNHGLLSNGIDYNEDYINICNQVSRKNSLNCTFEHKSFGEIDASYDCVTALGVIHHLYQRTENYNDLELVMKKFSEIAKNYLIVEFPTEHDSKAAKWTSMAFRRKINVYGEDSFTAAANGKFKIIKKIDGVTPTRPIYLMQNITH